MDSNDQFDTCCKYVGITSLMITVIFVIFYFTSNYNFF